MYVYRYGYGYGYVHVYVYVCVCVYHGSIQWHPGFGGGTESGVLYVNVCVKCGFGCGLGVRGRARARVRVRVRLRVSVYLWEPWLDPVASRVLVAAQNQVCYM